MPSIGELSPKLSAGEPYESDRKKDPYIAIVGNIGVGKSELAGRLAKSLSALPLLEEVARNPFFGLLYEDAKAWAFHAQVSFLADAVRRHVRAQAAGPVVQDRIAQETIEVFGPAQKEAGFITARDLVALRQFSRVLEDLVREPTHLVYLYAPIEVLLARIRSRARKAEREIDRVFLERLENNYLRFVDEWDACPIVSVNAAKVDLRDPREVEKLSSLLLSG